MLALESKMNTIIFFIFTTVTCSASETNAYLKEKDAFEVKDLVSKEPYKQFENWFEQAKVTPGIEEANAMCIATATKTGLPSARCSFKGLWSSK